MASYKAPVSREHLRRKIHVLITQKIDEAFGENGVDDSPFNRACDEATGVYMDALENDGLSHAKSKEAADEQFKESLESMFSELGQSIQEILDDAEFLI